MMPESQENPEKENHCNIRDNSAMSCLQAR